MGTTLQKKGIDIDKGRVIGAEKDGCLKPPVKTMPDKEYVTMMEECYRIQEEGIF